MTVLVVDFSTVSSNPLNPLGLKLRKLIWESLDQAQNDANVQSVVLTGGQGGNFSAGADLTEFGQLQNAPHGEDGNTNNSKKFFPLVDLVHKIENYSKPVIAAISGNALGGGLEVALSCHYRLATSKSKLGLPEVNVGVIPGAGGTQRLPRLVGVGQALHMIVSGAPIKANQAKKLGLVDDVVDVDDNLLTTAHKWAKWAELMPLNDRRVGQLPIKENQQQLTQIFKVASQKLPSIEMGGEGVHAALIAVKACTLPIRDGSQVELEQFFKTLMGAQGKARRHAFFAIRSAQKPLGRPSKQHPLLQKSIVGTQVAVVGAGLMGSGIALTLLQAGFHVTLVDLYKQSLEKGMTFINTTIQSKVKRGKLPEGKAKSMIANLKSSQRLEDVASCHLVVEAVIEDMKIKKSIFAKLEQITNDDCILLSNTSTLDVDEMASALSTKRRSLFAGWHFFSPAHVMKLVEIVVGKATSLPTTCILQQLTKRIGKIGVVCGNCDGFIGNRLLISYGAETTLMLEEGVATVSSVDKAFLKFGIALGPFQMADLAGLDIGYNIRKQRGWINSDGSPSPTNRPERYPEVADVIVSQYKRLGQKSGKVRLFLFYFSKYANFWTQRSNLLYPFY